MGVDTGVGEAAAVADIGVAAAVGVAADDVAAAAGVAATVGTAAAAGVAAAIGVVTAAGSDAGTEASESSESGLGDGLACEPSEHTLVIGLQAVWRLKGVGIEEMKVSLVLPRSSNDFAQGLALAAAHDGTLSVGAPRGRLGRSGDDHFGKGFVCAACSTWSRGKSHNKHTKAMQNTVAAMTNKTTRHDNITSGADSLGASALERTSEDSAVCTTVAVVSGSTSTAASGAPPNPA